MTTTDVRGRVPVILLVEDDPADRELTRRALVGSGIDVDLRIVLNGEEALDYLYRKRKYQNPEKSPTPDLILMDLNMPGMDGRQVLQRLKGDPQWETIPIVVVTTSSRREDVVASYQLGCKSFVTKPMDMDQFTEAIHRLGEYWFKVVTLPNYMN